MSVKKQKAKLAKIDSTVSILFKAHDTVPVSALGKSIRELRQRRIDEANKIGRKNPR